MEDQRCEDRVKDSFESTMDDLRQLWAAYCNGEEEVEDLGTFYEYGLCFDYVSADTFTDQKPGYFRYQLSYGGPSTEFRYYTDADLSLYKIEYWLLDWFDGAHVLVDGDDYKLMGEIFDMFKEIGSVEMELEKATA